MTIQPETIVVEVEGMNLSRLLWRRFRRPMFGLLERVLDLNPGLAALGPHIPVGTAVVIPIDRAETGNEPEAIISLWS